jgi:hypothetical protein
MKTIRGRNSRLCANWPGNRNGERWCSIFASAGRRKRALETHCIFDGLAIVRFYSLSSGTGKSENGRQSQPTGMKTSCPANPILLAADSISLTPGCYQNGRGRGFAATISFAWERALTRASDPVWQAPAIANANLRASRSGVTDGGAMNSSHSSKRSDKSYFDAGYVKFAGSNLLALADAIEPTFIVRRLDTSALPSERAYNQRPCCCAGSSSWRSKNGSNYSSTAHGGSSIVTGGTRSWRPRCGLSAGSSFDSRRGRC